MTTPAAPRKSNSSTLWLLVTFGLVIFVLFNPAISQGLGRYVGYVLEPIIGFGGQHLLATVFLASILLVVATTAIRHFLVDWAKMARVQEAMRTFQKEFSDARKSNNTYKMKKLTDAQPQVMELQAELSADQMKPMVFTMLLVIPIFAWLGTYVGSPVDFHALDHTTEPIILVGMDGFQSVNATVLSASGGTITTNHDLVGYAIRPTAMNDSTTSVTFEASRTRGQFSAKLADAPVLPASAKIATLPAGAWNVKVEPADKWLTIHGDEKIAQVGVDRVTLVWFDSGVWHTAVVARDNVTITTNGADLYAIVPNEAPSVLATGQTNVTIFGQGTFPVTTANIVNVERSHGFRIIPHETQVPWNPHWSFQDRAVLITWHTPFNHWIALYSLFGIPIGQMAQRALKLWEYRNHEAARARPAA